MQVDYKERPTTLNPNDYDIAYLKWVDAKQNKDYALADSIRDYIEWKHGITFSGVGEELTIRDSNETTKTTAVRMSYYDYLKKYTNATEGLLETISASDSKYSKLHLAISVV